MEPAFPFLVRDAFMSAFEVPPDTEVAGYMPIGSEADPRALLFALEGAGAAVSLPVTLAAGAPLLFRRWRTGERLIEGRYGIPEPQEEAEIARPSLFLVPLLAFDARGTRLGYGAGHYDATLKAARRAGLVLAVGIAYAGQEAAHLPREAHDEALDAVATEQGVRMIRQGHQA